MQKKKNIQFNITKKSNLKMCIFVKAAQAEKIHHGAVSMTADMGKLKVIGSVGCQESII